MAARRVVSLIPAVTETLHALDASDLLVARTDADRDPDMADLPSVGSILTPNLEVVAAAEPDLVVAWAGSDVAGLERAVEGRGGRVEALSVDRLDDLVAAIAQVGSWIGRTGAADRLSADLRATLELARSVGSQGAPARVLWVVWSEPIVVAGPGTFLDDVIAVVGGRNAMVEGEPAWARVGLESLVALDPEVLVWPTGPGMFPAASLRDRSGWSLLSAVRGGRVVQVEAHRFHVPGPGIADAALDLAHRVAAVQGL